MFEMLSVPLLILSIFRMIQIKIHYISERTCLHMILEITFTRTYAPKKKILYFSSIIVMMNEIQYYVLYLKNLTRRIILLF